MRRVPEAVTTRARLTLPVLAGCLLAAAPAHGHGSADAGTPEAQIRTAETAALGAAHAREHASARTLSRREAARLAALTPSARRARRTRAAQQDAEALAQAREAVTGRPRSEVGEWSGRYGLPDYVMHAALLRSGEIAMWGWAPRDTDGSRPLDGETYFWDTTRELPALAATTDTAGALRRQDPPPVTIGGRTLSAPTYCSGVSFLADGRLLVTGGNRAFPDDDAGTGWAGLETTFVYDPVTRAWSRGPVMHSGRWYPTQLLLPDGRTWIGGGLDETGLGTLPADAEILDAGAGALTRLAPPAPQDDGSGEMPAGPHWGLPGWPGMYPHAFVMPGGDALVLPDEYSRASALMTLPATGPAGYVADGLAPFLGGRHDREGSTAVLLPSRTVTPSQTVLQIGGLAYTVPGTGVPDGRAKRDVRAITPQTLPTASPFASREPLNTGRSYHNTVILPGGDLVTVGGGAGNDPDTDPATSEGIYWDADRDPALLNAELHDAGTGRWSVLAPQSSFRSYHSVALLLPDGRVWSAGDDFHSDRLRQETGTTWRGNAEIFSPPYLFGAADPGTGAWDPDRAAVRPQIGAGPDALGYGFSADVAVSGAEAESAVLVAPGAPTHAVDTNQRHVRLTTVSRSPGGLRVRLDADATTAPPGWYMLFALTARGTPSHARWVRVGATGGIPPAPDTGGGAPADPGPSLAAPGSVSAPPATPGAPPAAPARLTVTVDAGRQTRAALLRGRRLRVVVRASRARRLELSVALRRGARSVRAGRRVLDHAGRGPQTVSVPLSAAAVRALRGRARVTITVTARTAGAGAPALAVRRRTL